MSKHRNICQGFIFGQTDNLLLSTRQWIPQKLVCQLLNSSPFFRIKIIPFPFVRRIIQIFSFYLSRSKISSISLLKGDCHRGDLCAKRCEALEAVTQCKKCHLAPSLPRITLIWTPYGKRSCGDLNSCLSLPDCAVCV